MSCTVAAHTAPSASATDRIVLLRLVGLTTRRSESDVQVLHTLGLLQLLKKRPPPGAMDVSPGDALVAFARLGVVFALGENFARAVAALDIVDERSTDVVLASKQQQQQQQQPADVVHPLVTPVSVAVDGPMR
jgi:hypothetical protein